MSYEVEFEFTITGERKCWIVNALDEAEAVNHVEQVFGKDGVLLFACRNLKQLYELGIR